HLRPSFDQCDVVYTEGGLQGRVLEQVVEYDVRNGIALQNIDDAHPLPIGFIPDVGNALDFLFIDHVGGLLDHVRLVDLIGNLGHHDAFAALDFLKIGPGPDNHPATTGMEGLFDPVISIDDAAGRKIRGLNMGNQLVDSDFRVIYIGHGPVHDLGKVVRGHVGGHSHGDPGGAVDQ